jgi:hypothetical protein
LNIPKSLKTLYVPSLAISGGGVHNLHRKLISIIGKTLSEKDKELGHKKLDSLIDPKQIDFLLDKIASYKDIKEFKVIEYAPCLALSLAINPKSAPLESNLPEITKGTTSGRTTMDKDCELLRLMPDEDLEFPRLVPNQEFPLVYTVAIMGALYLSFIIFTDE